MAKAIEEKIDPEVTDEEPQSEALSDDDLGAVDELKAPAQSVRESLAEVAFKQAKVQPDQTASITAPEHWKDDDKKLFTSIADQKVRDYILRRDKEYQTGVGKQAGELAALKKEHEPIRQMFAPYADMMKKGNLSIPQVIGNYLKAEQALLDSLKPGEDLVALQHAFDAADEQKQQQD